MSAWILIILMHGWGAGVGSQGNFAAGMLFTTQERCEAAAKVVAAEDNRSTHAYCVRR